MMRPAPTPRSPPLSFVLIVLVLAVCVSYLRGGRLSRVAEAPLRSSWLLFAGVAVQVGVDVAALRGLLLDASTLGWVLLLVSQLLVVTWVALNWQLPGMVLVALGLALNATVMAANGAMPVHVDAITALGVERVELTGGKHTVLTADTRLPWLADIWPLPALRSIISVGDVVLAAGLLPVTHALMSYRPTAERRGKARSTPSDDATAAGTRATAAGTRGSADRALGTAAGTRRTATGTRRTAEGTRRTAEGTRGRRGGTATSLWSRDVS